MKNFLLLLVLLPSLAWAEDVEVLVMTVSRTSGSAVTAQLWGDDDFVGPILNMESDKLYINNLSFNRSRIKEIRFSVETVDAVTGPAAACDAESGSDAIYDLQGRRISRENMHKGIYIIKGKKYIKQ